jgi:hypothetical protein
VERWLRRPAAAGLYRPVWEYGAMVLVKDLGDHLVYGVSAAAADRLLAGR